MGDTDASRADRVDDEPGVGEPGDFGTNQAENERDQGTILAIALDEDVIRGGVADNEGRDHEDDRVGDSGEDRGRSRADQDCAEGLENGGIGR